jgi:hypothetical protein
MRHHALGLNVVFAREPERPLEAVRLHQRGNRAQLIDRHAGGDQGRGQRDERDSELADGGRRQGLASRSQERVGVFKAVQVVLDLLLQGRRELLEEQIVRRSPARGCHKSASGPSRDLSNAAGWIFERAMPLPTTGWPEHVRQALRGTSVAVRTSCKPAGATLVRRLRLVCRRVRAIGEL